MSYGYTEVSYGMADRSGLCDTSKEDGVESQTPLKGNSRVHNLNIAGKLALILTNFWTIQWRTHSKLDAVALSASVMQSLLSNGPLFRFFLHLQFASQDPAIRSRVASIYGQTGEGWTVFQYICFGRWQTDSTTRRFLCQRSSVPKEPKMQLSSLVLVSTHSLTGACSEYLSLPHATQTNQGNCQ